MGKVGAFVKVLFRFKLQVSDMGKMDSAFSCKLSYDGRNIIILVCPQGTCAKGYAVIWAVVQVKESTERMVVSSAKNLVEMLFD